MITTVDKLLIRACKSLNADTRLKSVYRRFYAAYEVPSLGLLASLLADIVNDLKLLDVHTIMRELNPDNFKWKGYNYEQQCYYLMRNTLRHASVEQLGDTYVKKLT